MEICESGGRSIHALVRLDAASKADWDKLMGPIKPVLITSLSRRDWGDDGKIHSRLEPNVKVVKEIAAEKHVPLIDLHDRSIELYEKLGKDGCNELSPKKPDGSIDNTHLNAKGSQTIGPIVAEELKKAVPELAPHIK